MRERPVSHVPRWVRALLAGCLAAQIGLASVRPAPSAVAADLRPPPTADTLQLLSVGEPSALGKLLMLWLQAFDYQPGTRIPYRDLDYGVLIAWLERILALDPAGQYPLMSASRLYAEVPDPAKQRQMLDLVYREYLRDPDRRWPWLAHATIIAKHRLKDLPLARKYAVALQQNTRTPDAPVWVRQMEPFILEDMNEFEAAKVIIGGLLASGQVKDDRDYLLLKRRLEELEDRLRSQQGPPADRDQSSGK